MKQVKLLTLYPLAKGLDKSSVAGTQDIRSLRRAKNVVLSSRPSLRKRPGQRRIPYIGGDGGVQAAIHFFGTSGSSQFQEVVRVRKGKVEALRDLGGSEPQWVDLGLTVSDTDTVTFERINNALVLHFENTRPYYYTVGGTLTELPILASHVTSPPTISRVHDFRYWYSGRRSNPHVVYVSAPGSYTDYTLFGGGFSMSINTGDGDPVGITAISPPFQGQIYAYKWAHAYRIYQTGYGYGWLEESREVGAVHHNAVCATKMDLYSVDISGLQSLLLARQYDVGGGETALTKNIYEWFQETINWSLAKQIILTYDKTLGCLLMSYPKAGSSVNNAVLGMNVFTREFFEWEDVEYPAIGKYYEFGRERTMVADETRGVCVLDLDETTLCGDPIDVEFETGPVFPMGNPKLEVQFTGAWLCCRPTSSSSEVTIYYSIDGKEEVSRTVDMVGGGHGSTIEDSPDEGAGLIGTDLIGTMDADMATIPFEFSGDGACVSFRVVHEPSEEDAEKELEIFGIIAEYETSEDTEQKKTA